MKTGVLFYFVIIIISLISPLLTASFHEKNINKGMEKMIFIHLIIEGKF